MEISKVLAFVYHPTLAIGVAVVAVDDDDDDDDDGLHHQH